MSSILLSFLRDKKLNTIYILLFLLIIVVISIFELINSYYDYSIAKVFGKYIENRTYYIYDEDLEKMEKLKNSFNFTNAYDDGHFGYTFILSDYNDTKELNKYFEKNEINALLDGNNPNNEKMDIIKKNQEVFNDIEKILMIVGLVLVIFILKNIFINEEKNIALLKIVGYGNIKLSLIFFLKCIIILFISFVISVVSFYLLHFIYLIMSGGMLKDYIKCLDCFNPSYMVFKLLFVITFFCSFTNYFSIRKQNTLNILNS